MQPQPDILTLEIPIPEYGTLDPDLVKEAGGERLLLIGHNRALMQACQLLQAQVAALREKYEPKAKEPSLPTPAVVPDVLAEPYTLPSAEDLVANGRRA